MLARWCRRPGSRRRPSPPCEAWRSHLCGASRSLPCALLVLYWLWKEKAGLRTWILVTVGVCGNVSLILFSRQGRYYALAAFLTLLITYLYLHRDGRQRTIAVLSLAALALLATSY